MTADRSFSVLLLRDIIRLCLRHTSAWALLRARLLGLSASQPCLPAARASRSPWDYKVFTSPRARTYAPHKVRTCLVHELCPQPLQGVAAPCVSGMVRLRLSRSTACCAHFFSYGLRFTSALLQGARLHKCLAPYFIRGLRPLCHAVRAVRVRVLVASLPAAP